MYSLLKLDTVAVTKKNDLRLACAFAVVLSFCVASTQASAIESTHGVLSSFGGYSSSPSFSVVSAGAQGHPVGLLSDTDDIWARTQFNFGGFLQPTDLDLAIDTDGDGVPDVIDPDSDNDGIADVEELQGLWSNGFATNPKSADTDGDGVDDYEEWRAGTNPTDEESALRITQIIYNSPFDVRIRFHSIGGQQYELFRGTDLSGLNEEMAIDGTEGAPGVGPFNDSETEFSDVPFGTVYFYGVRQVP